MEVAVESPVNTQPPPLLFGGESPHTSHHLLPTPQSPIQALSPRDQIPTPLTPSPPTMDHSNDVQMEEPQDSRPVGEETAPIPSAQPVEPASEAAPTAEAAAADPMDTDQDNTQNTDRAESHSQPQDSNPPAASIAETEATTAQEVANPDTTEALPTAANTDQAAEAPSNTEPEATGQGDNAETQAEHAQQTNTSEATTPDSTPTPDSTLTPDSTPTPDPTPTPDSTPTPANEGETEMSDPPAATEENQTAEGQTENSTPEPPAEPEDPTPWAGVVDDTSAPEEDELKEIEDSSSHSAADVPYWESSFYDELEDPDHVPIEKTRITWTIKGVRGTKEKPMKELILKSPKALVGGHYWGFKFFPRGNNNNDLSIYIDCSNEPEKNETKAVKTLQFRCLKGPADADLSKVEPSMNILAPTEEPPVEKDTAEPKDETMKDDGMESAKEDSSDQSDPEKTEAETTAEISQESSSEVPQPEQATAEIVNTESQEASPDEPQPERAQVEHPTDSPESSTEESPQEQTPTKKEWRVSAQIGLVCYNPEEPRTRYHQTSYHMFTGENSDWGWTRFHGPWDQIHVRRRGQIKPLMQNDTIAMDAYIRIIKDDTRSLWWHSSEGEPNWPSMTLHGLRGLGSLENGSTPLITATMPWILLAPFRRIMYNVKMPTGSRYDEVPKYLCGALRKVIYLLREQKKSNHYVDVGTQGLVRAMKDYAESSSDVVSCWESLRRMLEIELEGTDAIDALSDIFDGRLDGDRLAFEREHTLKTNKNWISSGKEPTLRIPAEGVKDIQEGLERTFTEKSGPWALPKLLQVEIERQKFDKSTRKWQKIMDKVHLNEEVDLSKWTRHPEQGKYTLYGFVVHQGERTSGRFYSVLRPAGPGGKWFSFRETSENKIACLTSKEVKAAAEGPGPESVKATKPPGDVPYVALYVRTDVVSEFLKPELEPWEAPRSFRKAVLDYLPEGTKVEEDPEDYSRVTCEIYNSEIFKDHVGRGVFNAWDAGLRAKFPEKVLSINFSADTKISLLRWKLYKLLGLEKSEQVRLWPMTQLPPAPFAKNFNPPLAWAYLDTDLAYFHQTKLRMWLHILPLSEVPVLGILEPPIPIPIPEVPAEPEPVPEEPQTDVAQEENAGDAAAAEPATQDGEQTAQVTEVVADPPTEQAEGDANLQPEAEMTDAPAAPEASNPAGEVAPQEPVEVHATPAEPEVIAGTEPTEPDVVQQVTNAPAVEAAEETMPDAPAVAAPELADTESAPQPAAATPTVPEVTGPTVQPAIEPAPEAPAAPEPSADEPAMDTTEDLPAPTQAAVEPMAEMEGAAQPVEAPVANEEAATEPAEVPSNEEAAVQPTETPTPIEETPAADEEGAADEMAVDPQAQEDDNDADLQEALRRSLADAEAQQAAEAPADTDMQDAQPENPAAEPTDNAETTEAETAAAAPEPVVEEPVIKQNGCYVFVQRFNPFEQRLTGIGSFVAKGEANIKETVRKYLDMPKEAEFLVWETHDSYTTKSINTGQSFYDAEIGDGTILIVRDSLKTKECVSYPHPSPPSSSTNLNDSTTTLEAKADFPNPQDHLRYLAAKSRSHPVLSKTHPSTTISTYGTPSYSGAITRGHYHGHGTLISDAGETYTGPFILGDRSGANGQLVTASGDTYTGSFYQGQRHGEGTFLEHKTGNKYVGGWQQDKRHGKGVTYWEVADEEMNICQICYGAEQDALFYDCGHVCACTGCARQVEVCPICRANVKGVVRIYRT
jgi:hypothetical protein